MTALDRAGDIITRRLPAASSYAADITIVPEGQDPFKIAAMVLKPNIVLTFCHSMHSNKEVTNHYWLPDIGTWVTVSVGRISLTHASMRISFFLPESLTVSVGRVSLIRASGCITFTSTLAASALGKGHLQTCRAHACV